MDRPAPEQRVRPSQTAGALEFHGHIASPARILEIGYAFWRSKALLSAVELDVFTIVADEPKDLKSLVTQTGIHERGARDFFDALVALGLLYRDQQDRYGNTADSSRYLDRHKPTYLGELLAHLNARHYQNWSLLTQALRTGAPQSTDLGVGSYRRLHDDPATQEIFLNGMTGGSLLAAQALARKFPWQSYKTVIDVGAAQGCLLVEVLRAHSHLTGLGFDLPPVAPIFAGFVRKHGLSHRLHFCSGDFFSDPLPPADVIVMGRILHNWDLPTKKMLIAKAYQALPPGGALIIYDPIIDDDRRVHAHALLSSLNMLIETAAGFEYTSAQCKEWMGHAGFNDVRAERLEDVHTAVVGVKLTSSDQSE